MLYSFFKGNQISFPRINSDKRCQIQPITKFQIENHWCVDRWWSKIEKQELGIESENLIYGAKDFSILLDEMASRLLSSKEIV